MRRDMTQVRKYGIILAVAILYSIFVFSLGNAVIPEREYPEFCEQAMSEQARQSFAPLVPRDECPALEEPTQEEIDACPGTLSPDWRTSCPEQYICNCQELQQEFRSTEATIQFWIAIVLGFIAIVAGMLLPSKNELNEWVGAGFILGGLITLFIATAQYWGEIHRIARPIVIALELAVVLWIAYRQFGDKPKKKK